MSHVVVESTDHEMPTAPLPLCDSAQENLVERQAKRQTRTVPTYMNGRLAGSVCRW